MTHRTLGAGRTPCRTRSLTYRESSIYTHAQDHFSMSRTELRAVYTEESVSVFRPEGLKGICDSGCCCPWCLGPDAEQVARIVFGSKVVPGKMKRGLAREDP
eukprot:scaffold40247_cov65-Phaeocystis_antarctica.AAC.8